MRVPATGSGHASAPGSSSRREFLRISGVAVLSAAAGGAACSSVPTEAAVGAPTTTGLLEGVVTNVQGTPQGNFGTLILMYPSGQHVGLTVTPDAQGRFRFPALPAGEYQLRFQAAGQAIVPEPYQHPLKCQVEAGRTTALTVRILRGTFAQNQVEIYCGDDFFQCQPDGPENGETVVPLGTVVCWYNVGRKVHTVTGGPWDDSGDLQKTQSYIWVASVPGVHAYRCKYNQPGMRATLRVLG